MSLRSRLLVASFASFFVAGAPLAAEEENVLIKPADPAAVSPKEALRKQIFEGTLDKHACATVRSDVEKEIDFFLRLLLEALKKDDAKALHPLFHPQLNATFAQMEETFGRMDLVYGKRTDVSLYRLWALNTVDGAPTGVACDGGEAQVFPLYGHPLQFAAYFSIMGQSELGRLYVGIVPAEGRWNIGSFVIQPWTHNGKDFQAWMKEGLAHATAGHRESAYVKYDLAWKLLEAGNYLELPVRNDVAKTRDAQMLPADWEKKVREIIEAKGDEKAVFISTMLVVEGAGILARLRVNADVSLADVKSRCVAISRRLLETNWAADLAGIRCQYNLPGEPDQKDGIIGGQFLPFADVASDLKKEQAKK